LTTFDPIGTMARLRFYLLYALAILVSQLIGYQTFYGISAASVIWPCAGVFGAALVITHRRHWWILVAVLIAIDQTMYVIMRDVYAGRAVQIVMVVKLIYNPTTGVVFALVVQRFVPDRNPMGGLRSLVIYTVGGIFLNLLLASLISWSLASLIIGDLQLIARWQQWSYSGISGMLAYATPIIVIANQWNREHPLRRYPSEASFFILLLLVVCVYLFAFVQSDFILQLYQFLILLPLLAWGIVRFGPVMLTFSTCVVVTVIMVGMSLERGPFHYPDREPFVNVLSAQGAIVPGMIGLMFISSLLESVRTQYEKQLEYEIKLRRLDRFETLGTMAGGVAHDFGNFAIALRSYRKVLDSQIKDRSKITNDALEGIEEIAESAQSMTRSLMSFAREEIHSEDESVRADLCKATESSIAALRPLTAQSNPLVAKIHDTALYVGVSSTDLKRMISNLILNAVDASPQKTPIHVAVTREGNQGVLTVEDYGEGIDRDVQERIFDPYFTTKAKGKGTGLGLSVVAGIVLELQGSIKVISHPGDGTTLLIKLPLLED
jgi:signal transduction histidine kinase